MRIGFLLASTFALAATSASAAPTITFGAGQGGNAAGTTVFQNFDSLAAGSSIGTFANVYNSDSSRGKRPAFGSSGNFAAVLGGGTYTVNFAQPANTFSFVLGSLDRFNQLRLTFSDGSVERYFGNQIIGGLPTDDGSATSTRSNGLVTFRTGSGPTLTGAIFKSDTNSFEFDNLAVGVVPEPATWALMILGFGAIGGAMRRRAVAGSLATA